MRAILSKFIALGLPTLGTSPSQTPNLVDQPPNLTLLANNSLFTYWRPKSHIMTREGWMNDPMGMWVTARPSGELEYHVGFQCHPQHISWGNVSQCAAVSNDLVSWFDSGLSQTQWRTLVPTAEYDHLGVFDGTMITLGYKGYPTIIYTGVRHLPTAWNIPYISGTESQNLAWTEDGGQTWKRLVDNPVIPSPPIGLNVTGWRDPFVFQSSHLDSLLLTRQKNRAIPHYLTISSGSRSRDVGPKLLLYRQANENLTSWDYLGPVFAPPANTSWSAWSGNFGFNFEVANFLRLNTTGDASQDNTQAAVDFATMGTEGSRPDHGSHWPLWVSGNVSAVNGGPFMNASYAGVGDWGEVYALLSFLDDHATSAPRRILIGWIYEDDNGYATLQKGWQGLLTLPREVFLHETTNVVASSEILNERGDWGHVQQADGKAIIQTLGVRPAREIMAAFTLGKQTTENLGKLCSESSRGWTIPFSAKPSSRNWYLDANIHFPASDFAAAGFSVFHSPDMTEETIVTYHPGNESLVVDRSKSSLVQEFNLSPDIGRLRLWNVSSNGHVSKESLHLTIIADNSVLEIYANGRFALTTRVYPWLKNSTAIAYWVGGHGNVVFETTTLYEGLPNVWPLRQSNTSQPLVWDGPNVPWAGN